MNVKKLVKFTLIGLCVVFVLPIVLLAVFVAVVPSGVEVIEKAQEIENTQVEESGLTTEKKQAIYKELVLVETKAREEAEAKYPLYPEIVEGNFEKNHELKKSLDQQYKNEVYSKYNITEKDGIGIIVEGVQNGWDEE